MFLTAVDADATGEIEVSQDGREVLHLDAIHVALCPACFSTAFSVPGRRTDFSSSATIEGQFIQPSYEMKQCCTCSLLYKSDTLTDSALETYYDSVDFRKWEIQGYFPTERRVLEILRTLPSGSRILDFGCSTGRLLEPLVGEYECFGMEINQEAARVAEQKGITIVREGDKAGAMEGTMTAVVLVDVIEHLRRPFEVLSWLGGYLQDGGIMVIVSGNSDAFACQRDVSNFWYLRNPEHLLMINYAWGQWLAARLGFDLVEWRSMSHYDEGLRRRMVQYAQQWAYWQFHGDRRIIPIGVLSRIPAVRKAASWRLPPALTCTADHVVAVLRQRSSISRSVGDGLLANVYDAGEVAAVPGGDDVRTWNKRVSSLPRLLYLGDPTVSSTVGGSALLHRLLLSYPPEKLMVLESNFARSDPGQRLPGVRYDELRLGPSRPASTRIGRQYLGAFWLAAPLFAGRAERLTAGFRPEAILTVAHGISWRIAAALAARLHIPLHLIVHDDLNVWSPYARLLAGASDRAFASVYRSATSRFCVSPYMRDSYRDRYGVEGSVLFPNRAPDLPEYSEPPRREVAAGVTLGFAGSVNHMTLPALQALASTVEALGAQLRIYSPLSSAAAGRLGILGRGVHLHAPIPPSELVMRLREDTDILVLPMGFDERNRVSNQHSFPSKLTDYTATGLPLLVWGPPSCSAVRWAREYSGVAEVVDREEPAAMAEALRRLVDDRERRRSMGTRALEVGRELFSNDTITRQFLGAIADDSRTARSSPEPKGRVS